MDMGLGGKGNFDRYNNPHIREQLTWAEPEGIPHSSADKNTLARDWEMMSQSRHLVAPAKE